MTQKHTPGPWKQSCESIDPDWHIVTTQGGAIIANVFAPQSANARLIAAAPDLLARAEAAEARVKELEGVLAKADALARVIESHATHSHAGKPYSPSMPKVFIALSAYQEARATLNPKGTDNAG